jgi:hypothetical protein
MVKGTHYEADCCVIFPVLQALEDEYVKDAEIQMFDVGFYLRQEVVSA